MATEMNVAVRLQADASQYTAEFTRAGTVAQDFSTRVSGSSSAAADSLQAVTDSLATLDASVARASVSGGKLASEYSGLSSSATAVAQAFTAAEQKVVDALQNEYAALGKTRTEVEKYHAAQMGMSSAAQKQVAAMATKIEAWHREEDAARAAANAQDQMAAQQASFVASLKAQTDTLGMSRRQLLEYQATQLGVADKASPLIQQLYGTEEAFNKNGMSAKAMNAAMRGVPAQMTDIVTSLQGGQAPLTVFLQQGGQLKDMFGGAGNAARALGGYVVGLVNPFTVAAAAAAVLAVAYYQGSKEAENYNKALILSGGIAGTTASQMADMARQLGQGDYTQGKAAAVIAELAQSGAVAGDQLQKMAATAIDVERATGQAIGKTAEVFKELAKEPLAASIKLNESLHYLTLSTYEHIKSLEEQGKKTEAGRVAMDAYADTMANRAKQITENNGFLETSWRSVGKSAAWAWDQMVGLGRAATGSEQLNKLKLDLAARQARGPLPGMEEAHNKGNKALSDQIALMERLSGAQQQSAKAQSEQDKALAAKAAWDKDVAQFQTNTDKRRKEIDKAQTEGQALINAGLLKEGELRTQIANINEKYKDKKGSAGVAGTGQNEVAGLQAKLKEQQAYLARLKEQSANPDRLNDAAKLSDGEKQVIKLNEELKTSITGVARAQKEKALATAVELAAVDKLVAGEEKRIKGLKESQASHDKQIEANFQAAASIEEQAAKQDAANAVFGKGKTAIEQMTLATLKNQLQEAEGSDSFDPKYIASLNAKIAAQTHWVKSLQGSDYAALMQKEQDWLDQAKERAALYEDEQKLAGLTNLERAKIVATRQIELKLAKELAEINKRDLSDTQKQELSLKAREAAEIDSSAAVSKVIQDDATKNADYIQQSLTDALMRGGKSGADYLKDLFRTMVLRPTINAFMAPVSGVINGAVNAGMSAMGLGGGGGGGGLMGMASNASSLSNLSSFNSGYFTDFGATMVGKMASTGADLFSKGFETIGQSMMDTGNSLAQYADVISGAGDVLGYAGALYSLSEGQYGAAILGAVGTYFFGPLGGAIGSYIGGLFDGDPSIPSVSNGGTTRTYGADGKVSAETIGQWGLGNAGGITDVMAAQYAAIQKGLMSTGGATFSFGSHTGDNNEAPEFRVSGGSGDKVYDSGLIASNPETMQREASRAILAALQSSELPASVGKMLDSLKPADMSSAQIDEAIKSVAIFIAQVKAMGPALDLLPLENLKDLSFDAAAGLAQAAGGFENLSSGLTTYMDSFVSDGEQRATKFRQITAALNAAGADLTTAQVMGASRRDFSDYRAAIDVTTEEGQKLVATLLTVSGAFAELTPELMSVASITSGLSKIIVDGMQSGDAAGAGQLFADTLIYGVQDALYQGFAEQVTSIVSDQLVSPLVTALVTGASINEAVSEASIATMVAQATAAAQALNALMTDSTFQSALSQISAAVSGAVSGSISIAGAGYRPVSAPSRSSYSSGGGGGGGGGAGSAGDRIKDEWKSICDSLVDEIKRVRGEVAGTGPQGVAYAQSAFAIATAQARAGDQDAAKSLPQLNRAYLDLVGSNASSALELRRAQAAQLASLEATNSMLAQKYGVTVPAFASGGWHAGGLRLVGERGPELEATGASRIYNAEQTRALFAGGGSADSSELMAEVRMLRTVLGDVLTATRLGTGYTRDIEGLLAKVTEKGSAMRSKAVAG